MQAVASDCKEIDLKEFINQSISKTPHKSNISNCTLLRAMIANGFNLPISHSICIQNALPVNL
jgi:hypothetical protein